MTTATAEAPITVQARPADAAPVKTNAQALENMARETEQTVEHKASLIVKIKTALADVRGLVLERARKQSVVIGYLAELLLAKPTNKQIAEALTETYDPGYHGPKPVTVIAHSAESGLPAELTTPKANPNPYRQQARRYKLLAMVEAGIAADGWDLSKIKDGVLIMDERFHSPVHALASGKVSMEACFQAYMNILQPKIVNLEKWSTSAVNEARKFAPKIKVTVRQFDKKMNREAKASIPAYMSASVFYGTVSGLIEAAIKSDTFRLSKRNVESLHNLLNDLAVPVEAPKPDAEPAK